MDAAPAGKTSRPKEWLLVAEVSRVAVRALALPSFDVARVVYLTRDRGAAPRLVFRRALEPARSATMEAPIDAQGKRADPNGEGAGTAPAPREELDVETYEANLTAETADVLEAVWTRMLERVRFPATPWLGEDGVRFQVSHWSPGRVVSGQTWSPAR